MNTNAIDSFIKKTDNEFIKRYFDELREKLKELNKRFNNISLLMLLMILIYYIIDKNIITSINIGVIALKDISLTKLFIPLIFSFFLFIYATLNSHIKEVEDLIRQIGKIIFRINNEKNDIEYILNMLLPFSFWKEFNDKYLYKANWWNFIFLLPLFGIVIVPVIFQIVTITDLLKNYWTNGIIEKLITIATIWIFLLTIMYYFKSYFKKNHTKAEQDVCGR